MDNLEQYCVYVVIKYQFSCNSVLLWRPIWSKRTQKCVNCDEMFLSTILLRHPSPINRVLHINIDTSDVPRTFYEIKMTDRLWCKLSALSRHVKLYDKL